MAFWNLCKDDMRFAVDEYQLGFNNYVIIGISFIWTLLIFSRRLKTFFQICFVLMFCSIVAVLRDFPGHLFTWWRSCNFFVGIKAAHCMEENLGIHSMNFNTFFYVVHCWGKETQAGVLWTDTSLWLIRKCLWSVSWVTFPIELYWNTTWVHGNRLAACLLYD